MNGRGAEWQIPCNQCAEREATPTELRRLEFLLYVTHIDTVFTASPKALQISHKDTYIKPNQSNVCKNPPVIIGVHL